MHKHAKIIEALGDGTAVAAGIWKKGAGPKERDKVYKWKKNGVPWKWRGTVAQLAAEQSVPLPRDFLSVTTHVAATKSNPRRTARR